VEHRSEGWTVWIDVEDVGAPAVGDDALGSFATLLESYFGVVGGTRTHGRYNARFTLDAANLSALDALTRGVGLFRRLASQAGLPAFPVVWTELMTLAEQHRQHTIRSQPLRPTIDTPT
jgi:hypothetical protein